MAVSLRSSTPAEAASAVRHLRREGWTEEQLAELILPYMPRELPRDRAPGARPSPPAGARTHNEPELSLPPDVTPEWLAEHLPSFDRRRLRLVVDELEHRGWPSGAVAKLVLPHLLPKLPADDARAVVAALAQLGMTSEEIARATTPRHATPPP